MKKLIAVIVACTSLFFVSCNSDDSNQVCSTQATIRDYTGLDGCGIVFELNDGSILEPRFNDPLSCIAEPGMATENPAFELTNGKKVSISYTLLENAVSTCMTGKIVAITCIREQIEAGN